MFAALFLSLVASAWAQTTPAGWKVVTDSKGACQIAVPPDWELLSENTARRIFYQEKISRHADDPNAYSVSVPGKAGTCSGHISALPSVSDETAKKIALSLGPVQP